MEKLLLSTDIESILLRNHDFFDDLKDEHFLILGASGFIGSWVTEVLLQANIKLGKRLRVTAVCRKASKLLEKTSSINDGNLSIVEIDLTIANLEKLKSSRGYDFILHAATSTKINTPIYHDNDLVLSTSQLLQNLGKFKDSQNKIIHLSSGALNNLKAPEDYLKLDEVHSSTSISTHDRYLQTKIEIERLVKDATTAKLISGSNPRLYTFYGPNFPLNEQYAIGNFMRQAITKNSITVNGHPDTIRSYMYPTDAVSWIFTIWKNPPDYLVNIGSKHSITIRNLAETISTFFGGIKINYNETSELPTQYLPDTSVIERNFSVIELVPLEDGLLRWKKWLTQ